MKIDARTAKSLLPGQRLIVDGCPGLRLVATRTHRTWTYRYKSPVDGRMRQVALGHWPAMSLAAAASEWERLRGEREAGVDPALVKRTARAQRQAKQQARADVYTVEHLVSDYLQGHIRQRRKAKGAAEIARLFSRHLGTIALQPASALPRAAAFELLEKLASTPVQANMLRRELAAAWDYAADAGRLPDSAVNWWRLVMRTRLRSKGTLTKQGHQDRAARVLSEAEIGELINWLPNFSPLIADILTMYLWTGTRGAEIVAMQATEITQENDGWWWTIPKMKTKNARHKNATAQRVPLTGRALDVVQRRMRTAPPSGWLFPASTKDGRITHSDQKVVGVAVWFHMPGCQLRPQEQRPRLPVVGWTPHILRRTVRTLLASMGCPADVAESVLGHMRPGVEGIYNLHSYDAERRHWLQRLSDRLKQAAKKRNKTRTN